MDRQCGIEKGYSLLAAAIFAACWPGLACANPQGPEIVRGTAAFSSPHPGILDVTNSPNAIINWQGFSIGSQELTRFIQQSSSSAVLNRVLGQDPSQILGRLVSNGRVFLINPNGIVFGPDSIIDTAGLVASTLGISDRDFIAGKLRFEGDAASGGIDNQGFITAGRGGSIYLIAPDIENSGIVHTDGGQLILAAGERVTITSLDLAGVEFEIASPDHEVVNLGQLLADGGAIEVFAGTLRHSGEIRADTVRVGEAGTIVLTASADIALEPGSVVSTAGAAGGVHGGGEVRIVAGDTLDLEAGALVQVDGGADGGDGGFLELSGHRRLVLDGEYTGRAHAPAYRSGSLHIDPVDIRIGGAGPSNATAGGYLADNGVDGRIDAADPGDVDAGCGAGGGALCITPSALAGGGWLDVHLQASGTISVEAAVADGDIPVDGSLTLEADQITVNADIGSLGTRFDHKLVLDAGDAIDVAAGIYVNDAAANFGAPDRHDLTLRAGTRIDLGAGATLDMASTNSAAPLILEVTGAGGGIDITSGASIAYAGAPTPGALVTLRADEVNIEGSINAPPSGVNLHTASAGRPIDLGSETVGRLSLTEAELNRITADDIRVGRFDSGDVTVSAPIDLTGASQMLTDVRSTLVIEPGASLSGASRFTLDASDFDIQGTIDAAIVRLSTGHSAGVPAIEIGTSGPGAGVAALDQSEIDRVTASNYLEIGAWYAPDIVVTAPIDVPASVSDDFRLESDGSVYLDASLSAVSLDVDLDAGEILEVGDEATLAAAGRVSGDLVNRGRLRPAGDGTGELEVTGNLTLIGSDSVVEIDFGGTTQGVTYDHLKVGGIATLDGRLVLEETAAFDVSLANSFEVLTYASSGGSSFDSIVPSFGDLYSVVDTGTGLTLTATDVTNFVFWDGGAFDLFWNSAANWSMDSVPDGVDVEISGAGGAVILSDSAPAVIRLESDDGLQIENGATLETLGPSTIAGGLTIVGSESSESALLAHEGLAIGGVELAIRGGDSAGEHARLDVTGGLDVDVSLYIEVDAGDEGAAEILADSAILRSGDDMRISGGDEPGAYARIEVSGELDADIGGSLDMDAGAGGRAEILSDDQTIHAASNISLTGGASGGTNASASIRAFGSQDVSADNDIALIAASAGAGDGNAATIDSEGSAQRISAGRDLTLIAGDSAGDANEARIEAVGSIVLQEIEVGGRLLMEGGRGGTNAGAYLESDAAQRIAAGYVVLQGGTAAAGDAALIGARDQLIEAGFVELHSHRGDARIEASGGVGAFDPVNRQIVRTSGANVAGEGILIDAEGSGFAGILYTGSGGETQAVEVVDADALRLVGTAGNARIEAHDADQSVVVEGSGANRVEVVAAGGDATIWTRAAGASQTLVAGRAGESAEIWIQGGTTGGSIAAINSAGPQEVSTPGGLHLIGGAASSYVEMFADGDQDITAGNLWLSTVDAAVEIGATAGAQSIATTDMNGAWGTGIRVYSSGGGSVAIDCQGGCTGQTIDVLDADEVVIAGAGAGGEALVNSDASQSLTVGGSGQNRIEVGGASASGFSAIRTTTGGSQTVVAGTGVESGAIVVQAGMANDAGAVIESDAAQTVETTGSVDVFGGFDGTAGIGAAGSQDLDAARLWIRGGIGQADAAYVESGATQEVEITGTLTIEGGAGVRDNVARLNSAGAQTVDAVDIVIRGGAGQRNDAYIGAGGGDQTVIASGSITIEGGASGSSSEGEILAYAGSAGQTVTGGAGGITLRGGGGSGNRAFIRHQGSTTQTVVLADGGDLLVQGGSGSADNDAEIRSETGTVTIREAAGPGVSDVTVQGGSGSLTQYNRGLIRATTGTLTEVTIEIDGDLSVLGGSGTGSTGNAAFVNSFDHTTTLTVGGDVLVRAGGEGTGAQAEITSETGMSIDAASLELIGGAAGSNAYARVQNEGAGTQSVTLSGPLTITGGNAGTTNYAYVITDGDQVVDASAVTVRGGAGGSGNYARLRGSGSQTVTAGAGGVTVSGGGGSDNYALLAHDGTGEQTVVLDDGGDVAVSGGTGPSGNYAEIRSETNAVTVRKGAGAGTTDITVTGGSGAGSSDNRAMIRSTGSGAFDLAVDVDGGMRLEAGTGAGSTDNYARVSAPGDMDVTLGADLVLRGGGGDGTGNSAGVFGYGTQTLDVRTLDLLAGPGGSGNYAYVQGGITSGAQIIDASDGIVLAGGAGGAGNFAYLQASSNSTSQTITTGASGMQVLGGAGTDAGAANTARVSHSGSGSQQVTLNDGGDLLIRGGSGVGGDDAEVRSSTGSVSIYSGVGPGTTDVTIEGGSGAGATANRGLLRSTAPAATTVTVDVDGDVTVLGGSGAGSADNRGYLIAQNGRLDVYAGGRFGVTGGTEGSANFARVQSASGQGIDAGSILIAGGASGTGNTGYLWSYGGTQSLFAGGEVRVAGGAGSGNWASVDSSSGSAGQHVDAGLDIAVVAGPSGDGNYAQISQTAAGAPQSLDAGADIQVRGGAADRAWARVRNYGTAQTLDAGADLLLAGGAGDGSWAQVDVDTSTQRVDVVGTVRVAGGGGAMSYALLGNENGAVDLVIGHGAPVGAVEVIGGTGPNASGFIGSDSPTGRVDLAINALGAFTLDGDVSAARLGSWGGGAGPGSIAVRAGLGGSGDVDLGDGNVRLDGDLTLSSGAAGGAVTQAPGGVIDIGASTLRVIDALLDLRGSNTVGAIVLQYTSDLVISSVFDTGGGDFLLDVGGSLSQTAAGAVIGGGTFEVEAIGPVSLASAPNALGGFRVTQTGPGGVSLTNTGALVVSGVTTTGGGDVVIVNDGPVTLGALDAAGGAVRVTANGAAILDGNGAATNASGSAVWLTAADGIGAGDAIETTTSWLAVRTGSGDVLVDNAGALLLASVVHSTPGGRVAIDSSGSITGMGGPCVLPGTELTLASAGSLLVDQDVDTGAAALGLSAGAGLMLEGAQVTGGAVNLAGGTVTVQPDGATAARVLAAGDMSVSAGTLRILGSDGDAGASAALDATGVQQITAGSVEVRGGGAAGAFASVDPTHAVYDVSGVFAVSGGSGAGAYAAIAADQLTINAGGAVTLSGGGPDAYALIASYSGPVSISAGTSRAPAVVSLVPGAGLDADAAVIAAAGLGTVQMSYGSCLGCSPLDHDPLGDGLTESGLYAADLFATPFGTPIDDLLGGVLAAQAVNGLSTDNLLSLGGGDTPSFELEGDPALAFLDALPPTAAGGEDADAELRVGACR